MWDVRFVFWCCVVLLCVLCVLCVLWCLLGCVCGVCCVVLLCCLAHGRPPLLFQNGACSTCARFAGTHGSVLNRTHGDVSNRHMGRREGEGVLFSLSSLPSLFLSSVSFSFSCSLPSLVFSLFSLSNNDNDHSSSRLSLCTHGSDLPESQSACTLAIPCLANMFVSCKKQLSWYNCASLVPLGMKWACICAGNGCCVWWCL